MDILGGIRRLITSAERRIFAGEDAAARHRGWQVSRRSTGFGRIYRDPRWDLISECESCGGDGVSAVEPCPSCAGRGTVRHDPSDAPLRDAP